MVEEVGLRPFQGIQVDCTELYEVQQWKYLLVIAILPTT